MTEVLNKSAKRYLRAREPGMNAYQSDTTPEDRFWFYAAVVAALALAGGFFMSLYVGGCRSAAPTDPQPSPSSLPTTTGREGVERPRFAPEPEFDARRETMVRHDIEGRGVRDRLVLDAIRKVPRQKFVPEHLLHLAYADFPLPIGEGQTISQPYVVAFMTEALCLKGGERVLEIGTGSGYQAAVLAEICKEVYTIEIVQSLADRSKTTLAALGYGNIHVRCGDGFQGWREHAPFDAVIITCAPEEIPKPLLEQLAPGGRLVVPVGPERGDQVLIRATRNRDETIVREKLMGVRFVPMTGEAQKE
ncbi:MAG: protein-L-isoaspartate(D-aspartate) O-methyltransferase [Planctomycetota bacterium]|nr:protein-L-isoaspartate(D-aspartate) O-methyltransferase [Planctomycetota bacterium]